MDIMIPLSNHPLQTTCTLTDDDILTPETKKLYDEINDSLAELTSNHQQSTIPRQTHPFIPQHSRSASATSQFSTVSTGLFFKPVINNIDRMMTSSPSSDAINSEPEDNSGSCENGNIIFKKAISKLSESDLRIITKNESQMAIDEEETPKRPSFVVKPRNESLINGAGSNKQKKFSRINSTDSTKSNENLHSSPNLSKLTRLSLHDTASESLTNITTQSPVAIEDSIRHRPLSSFSAAEVEINTPENQSIRFSQASTSSHSTVSPATPLTATTPTPNSVKYYSGGLHTPTSPNRPRIGSVWVKNSDALNAIQEKVSIDLFDLLGFSLLPSSDVGDSLSSTGFYLFESDDVSPLMEWWEETGTGQAHGTTKGGSDVTKKYVIKSGSLRCLVNQLIVQTQSDPDYTNDFLRTYRYFAESLDVGRLLVLRYLEIGWTVDPVFCVPAAIEKLKKVVAAAGGSVTSGPTQNGTELASFLQLRLLNTCKKWINDHPADFGKSPALQELMGLFLNHVKSDVRKTVFAESMMKTLEEKLASYRSPHSHSASVVAVHSGHGGGITGSYPVLSAGPARLKHNSLPLGSSPSISSSTSALSVSQQQPGQQLPPMRGKALSEAISLDKLSSSAQGSSSNLFASFTPGNTMKRTPGDRGSMNFTSIASTLSSLSSMKSTTTISSEKDDMYTSNPDIALGVLTRRGSKSPGQPTAAKSNSMSLALALSMLEPPKIAIADIEPEKLAEQLTLIEHNQFKRIKMEEFYCQAWNSKSENRDTAVRLKGLISWFNKVAYGVATEVVNTQKIKDRVLVLKKLIYVADCCLNWNNFNTAFEIVAGLNLGPVSRLKKTVRHLSIKMLGDVT
jgi:hypothetical protein